MHDHMVTYAGLIISTAKQAMLAMSFRMALLDSSYPKTLDPNPYIPNP